MSNNTHDCEIFFFVFLQHASCIASCGITIRIYVFKGVRKYQSVLKKYKKLKTGPKPY